MHPIKKIKNIRVLSTYLLAGSALLTQSGCTGAKLNINLGGALGNNVLSDTGATRVEGGSFGAIYNVTTVVSAEPYGTAGATSFFYTNAQTTYDATQAGGVPFPFIPVGGLEPVVPTYASAWNANRHTPFHFRYSYPPNNYKLANARLVVELNRDDSGTEALFVDGVLSGVPVCGDINTAGTSPVVPAYRLDQGCATANPNSALTPKNTNFNSIQARHYRSFTINFADFNIDDMINWTMPLASKPSGYPTTRDLVSDGLLRVGTSDDTPVYQGKLFLNGYTISKTSLSCSTSPTYNFRNVYVYNDGNSIGLFPFLAPGGGAGTNGNPGSHYTVGTQSVNFYYEPLLPNVPTNNVTITMAKLTRHGTSNETESGLIIRRDVTIPSAIVINGVAIAQTGFDATRWAAANIEEYLTGASQTYWETWLAASNAATTGADFTVPPASSLDLIQLMGGGTAGAEKLRGLLAQGKLDIAFAGGISVVKGGQRAATTGLATSTRSITLRVDGPELVLRGTFNTQLCAVPNDPSSPLTDTGALPDPTTDTTSPTISSIQVVEITSSSAKVQWLTDEPADSQVLADSGTTTPVTSRGSSSTDEIFHEIVMTGLQPYTKYFFQIRSRDASTANPPGNLSTSSIGTFTTKR